MTYNKKMEIGGVQISILRKSNLKNLYIRVNPPDGAVTVSAPMDITDDAIELFVLKKLPEIKKIQDKMIAQHRQTRREYVSGEAHYLWGRPYRLQVIYDGRQSKIVKTPTKIVMTVPEGTSEETRERLFTEWYRQEMKRVLDTAVARCEKKTGLHAEEYRIKNMRTRWGTCNIDKRRIWINLQLVKKPMECLDYVLIHELVHLVEKNHTNRFHALVEQYCPSWREAKMLLEEMPLDYLEKEERGEQQSITE